MTSNIYLQGQLHDLLRLLKIGPSASSAGASQSSAPPQLSAADAEEVTRLRASVPSRTTPNLFSCGPLSYQILAYILENLDAYKDTITWMPTSRFATSSITATTTSPKWVLTPDRIREVFEEVYGESIWSIVGTESKTRQILQVSALRSTAVCTVPEYKI